MVACLAQRSASSTVTVDWQMHHTGTAIPLFRCYVQVIAYPFLAAQQLYSLDMLDSFPALTQHYRHLQLLQACLIKFKGQLWPAKRPRSLTKSPPAMFDWTLGQLTSPRAGAFVSR